MLQLQVSSSVTTEPGKCFKPHQRGGGCCSSGRCPRRPPCTPRFKPHQRGGGCCSGIRVVQGRRRSADVSNPISGEVGAAAKFVALQIAATICFKPHQRGGGCCSWALTRVPPTPSPSFKPHQRGGGCCSSRPRTEPKTPTGPVSNPISGEVGAAAFTPVGCFLSDGYCVSNPISGEVGAAAALPQHPPRSHQPSFQTPSAGRWVLQPSLVLLCSVASWSFKPHQRGGGCCSGVYDIEVLGHRKQVSNPISGEVGAAAADFSGSDITGADFVSNPISGEVGAAALRQGVGGYREGYRFKPHQRGGGCCSLGGPGTGYLVRRKVSNPISGEVGAAASSYGTEDTNWTRFKPHQRGGGCCSTLEDKLLHAAIAWFQTPSAGRWVLQLPAACYGDRDRPRVSNPISGEVGAAACGVPDHRPRAHG